MKGAKNYSVASVVIAVALLLLLPTTLLYLGGVLFALLAYFYSAGGGFQPQFLPIIALLILPGYALYCLWWLVVKFHKVTLQEIPKSIWGGLTVGGLIALLVVISFATSGGKPPTKFISYTENIEVMLIYGGGPLLVVLILLFILWTRGGRNV